MELNHPEKDDFLGRLTSVIEANLTNHHFGVSMLAKEMGISRSNLHRKVNTSLKISVSQYINQIRVENAREILRHTSATVSEVAYKVGYNSVSYFIRCFHEFYGYSPGEVGNREIVEYNKNNSLFSKWKKRRTLISIAVLSFFLVVFSIVIISKPLLFRGKESKKSIAVIPPTYIGSDSSYIHQVNGTISMVLDNLSLMEGMEKVIPWTTVQKYRNTNMSVRDISRELGVNYIVESNGMPMEDKTHLNIKLIDGKRNNQIWYYSYEIQKENFIKLPQEIAINIAGRINAKVSREEKERIEKMPTENITAWNYFLAGKDLFTLGLNEYYEHGDAGNEGIDKVKGIHYFKEAIAFFEKALELDNNFALAYAQIAIIYFFMEKNNNEGKYSLKINQNADKAILNDSHHEICLLSKAYDYMNKREYNLAIPFLEKAILFNPKSTLSYRLLSQLYNIGKKDSEKYLEYQLLTVKNGQGEERIQKSEDLRMAARALRVAGFYEMAESYIDRALELNPKNYSSIGEKGEIIIEKYNDYLKTRELLNDALNYDSQNLEILRFLFTNCYLTKEYENALNYYKIIFEIDSSLSFMAITDYSRLAIIYRKLNMDNEFLNSLEKFKNSERSYVSSYVWDLHMSRLCCLENDIEGALAHIKNLSMHKYHFSHNIRMLKDDSVFEVLHSETDFQKILSEMETKFWDNHERIKNNLEKKGLLKMPLR